MNTRLYLDTRNKNKYEFPLKYAIAVRGKTAYIDLGIKATANEWDAVKKRMTAKRANHKTLNLTLERKKLQYDDAVQAVALRSMTALQVRDAVLEYLDPKVSKTAFVANMKAFANTHNAPRTREIYEATENKVVAFEKYKKRNPDNLNFEQIDRIWLTEFNEFMKVNGCTAINARSIHLRNIKATFNNAIADEIIERSPFVKFKIEREQTRKRSLSIEQLRSVFRCEGQTENERVALCAFRLIFFLIGINVVDLYKLQDIVDDRVEYRRSKLVSKKVYSIKVEPETKQCIDYLTENTFLDKLKRYKDCHNLNVMINDNLKIIARRIGVPAFTTYWARHTWATLCYDLDIPKETISQGLGHTLGSATTDIYIRYTMRKVDEANRRMIDYVLYSK